MRKLRFECKVVLWAMFLGIGPALAISALAESKFSFASTPGQLPKDVVPQHYALTIKPDIQTRTFKGSEIIDIDVQKAESSLVLNSLELKITTARLVGDAGQTAQIQMDEAKQIATLTFPGEVKVGRHKLELEFEGSIALQSRGLYYDKYQTDQGEKILLATQMEPTDARRMFPCWDEPVFRATFQLTVQVPKQFMAVSNMPIESERPLANELKRVAFKRTPRMSSYLLVLVAGELEGLSGEAGGAQVRIITAPGKKEKGQYALEVTKKLLTYYNDYFGIKYPLPKLDQIAIPGGFGGAMENWGGIIYNESVLLFDPKSSSQDTRQTIFWFISHEVAHQWFGDLVTMAWWDNVWLNEAFASWIAYKASDHFNPEWNEWLRANGSKNWAMGSDARKTTHPIQQPVTNPSEAIQSFDEITYEKGWAVIRMLETYLGEDVFREGIRQYLNAHQFSNTTTADLWEALGKASGKAISEMAAGWTEQPGLPVILAKSSCVDAMRTLSLEQERFTVNDSNAAPLLWQIPVAVGAIRSGHSSSYVLMRAKTATLPAGSCENPIKINAGNVGYYRVKYDSPMFEELKSTIASELTVGDRLNLLSDAWALVEAARTSASDYLNLVQAMRRENSLAIWEEILGNLGFIDQLEIDRPSRSAFQAYARSLLGPVLERIGWDSKPGEEKLTGVLRDRLIRTLGNFKDEAVIAEARRRFQEFLKKPQSLAPDLRPSVLFVTGRFCDRATYDELHALGRKTQSTEEKNLFYGAMQAAQDPELAQESLKTALMDELPPSQSAFSVFGVAYSGEHAALAWEFACQNVKVLLKKLDSMARLGYIPWLAGAFSDSARAEKLEAFSKANLPEEAAKQVAKAAENIRFKGNLKQRELPNIDQWIQNQAQ